MSSQRGAAFLIVVLLIIVVVTFGAVVVGSISGSDVTDSSYQGASVEALYAAESGLERATKQLTTAPFGNLPTTCTTGLSSTQSIAAGRTFTTSNGLNTDFVGALLLNPNTQCRVRVSGAVAGTSAARSLHAVVDVSAIGGNNPTFNAPPGTVAPSGWTVTSGPAPALSGFDYTGGPDPSGATPLSCSRALHAIRAQDGGNDGFVRAKTTLSPSFTITGAQQVRVYFNWRAVELASGDDNCTIAENCPDGAEPNPCGDPGLSNDVQIRFTLVDSANVASSATFGRDITVPAFSLRAAGRTVTEATGCVPTTQRYSTAAFPLCSSQYQMGAPASKDFVTITIAGAGTRTIVRLRADIYLGSNGARDRAHEVWVDNIEVVAPTVTGVDRSAEWRDCAVQACP